jgi:hypothetical protein
MPGHDPVRKANPDLSTFGAGSERGEVAKKPGGLSPTGFCILRAAASLLAILSQHLPISRPKRKKGIPGNENSLTKSSGWGIRIRTLIHGVRVRCPTIERSPNKFKLLTYKEIARQGLPKALAGVLHLFQFQRFGIRGSFLVFRRSVPSYPSSGPSSVSPGGSQN